MFLQEYNYDEDYEDSPPLNCSTAEAIKGGQVTYSQVGDSIKYNIYALFLGQMWPSSVIIKVSFKSIVMCFFLNKHFNSKSHILNQNF